MAYNKKIEIQCYTEDQDDIGNDVKEWKALFTPWAEIVEDGNGRKYYEAAQTNSESDVVFKIRYTSLLGNKLTSELRIKYKDAIYDIKYIGGLVERARELTIRTVLHNGGTR
jgi:SPP1 family predicted phage head-tail adaptor